MPLPPPNTRIFPPLLPAVAVWGTSATYGPLGEGCAIPGKVGRRGRFTPPRAPGDPHQYMIQPAPTKFPPRSTFPSQSFHSNLVIHLFTTTSNKHLLSIYCVQGSPGFQRHRRNRTGKPTCPSRVYSLGEDRRGRGQQPWRRLLVDISVLKEKINRGAALDKVNGQGSRRTQCSC